MNKFNNKYIGVFFFIIIIQLLYYTEMEAVYIISVNANVITINENGFYKIIIFFLFN